MGVVKDAVYRFIYIKINHVCLFIHDQTEGCYL